MNKCIFLDRDGVLNVERGDYTYLPKDFVLEPGVAGSIRKIKEAGYLAIVITNQAGISRGIYTRRQMEQCHDLLMEQTSHLIDEIYYSPYHPTVTASLSRKPGTLMVERAIAKFGINPGLSWFVGDRPRDIECGQRMGMRTVWITQQAENSCSATYLCHSLHKSTDLMLT
jgi:D-glycero-D-manno-heptose 1,7-bisphosphate phosphatase